MANAKPTTDAPDANEPASADSATAAAPKAEAVSTPDQVAAEPVKGPAQPAKTAKAPTKRAAKKTTGQPLKTRKPSPPRKYSGAKAMTASKTAKDTLDTMTAASNDAIKDGFEKSLNAVTEFSAFQKDTVDAVIASTTSTAKSLEELNAAAVAFAKKSMEDSVAAAKSMAGAKSVQEVLEIQSDYAKSSLDALMAEVNKNSDLMSNLVKESFKPINDRFSAALELMQSQR